MYLSRIIYVTTIYATPKLSALASFPIHYATAFRTACRAAKCQPECRALIIGAKKSQGAHNCGGRKHEMPKGEMNSSTKLLQV